MIPHSNVPFRRHIQRLPSSQGTAIPTSERSNDRANNSAAAHHHGHVGTPTLSDGELGYATARSTALSSVARNATDMLNQVDSGKYLSAKESGLVVLDAVGKHDAGVGGEFSLTSETLAARSSDCPPIVSSSDPQMTGSRELPNENPDTLFGLHTVYDSDDDKPRHIRQLHAAGEDRSDSDVDDIPLHRCEDDFDDDYDVASSDCGDSSNASSSVAARNLLSPRLSTTSSQSSVSRQQRHSSDDAHAATMASWNSRSAASPFSIFRYFRSSLALSGATSAAPPEAYALSGGNKTAVRKTSRAKSTAAASSSSCLDGASCMSASSSVAAVAPTTKRISKERASPTASDIHGHISTTVAGQALVLRHTPTSAARDGSPAASLGPPAQRLQRRSNSDSAPIASVLERILTGKTQSYSMAKPWTRRVDGGINSQVNGERGDEIYYMGVIDILQLYNFSKRTETMLKSFKHDTTKISSVNAKFYADRFVEFMTEISD